MYDEALLLEKLEQINEALAKIERRFASIGSPDDFLDSDCGLDMLDGIAMIADSAAAYESDYLLVKLSHVTIAGFM